MKKLAGRLERVSPSLTVAIDSKAKALKAEGKDVIGLAAGEPDFDTADYIKEAAIASIKAGHTKYTPPAGMLDVKKSICKKFKEENGLDYSPTQIVISSGAKHCISNILTALIEEGDEVIIPAPFWVTYPELVKLYGGTPVVVSAGIETEFKITPDQLKQAITPNTKMVIINSPVNPTGAVYTKDELQQFAEIIVENDLYCMSDEIYEHLIYDGYEHVSIASFSKEIYDRTIVINGVSKAFAMTGWRIGYIGASEEIAKAISKVQSQATHHPANASQFASKAALDGSLDSVTMMNKEFVKRRDYLIGALSSIEGVKVCMPHGAFYAFPNISSYIGKSFNGTVMETSIDICAYLLDEELLALVPGDAFGAPGCVRLSYATDLDTIKIAVQRLESGLSKLS